MIRMLHLMGHNPKYWKSLRALEEHKTIASTVKNEFMDGVTMIFTPQKCPVCHANNSSPCLLHRSVYRNRMLELSGQRWDRSVYKKAWRCDTRSSELLRFYLHGMLTACGILIKTREGRPIKIDGNPDHPINRGKICAKGQQVSWISMIHIVYARRSMEVHWADVEMCLGNKPMKKLSGILKERSERKRNCSCDPDNRFTTTKKLFTEFKRSSPPRKFIAIRFSITRPEEGHGKKCYGSMDLPVIEWKKQKLSSLWNPTSLAQMEWLLNRYASLQMLEM